jgi:predicted alpha/beta-fold hydrolase
MWESLATTRRQDRLLHGVAKGVNVVAGVIALPLWLFGQRLREPFRRLLARLDTEPAPLPVAQPRERSMKALIADLEGIPHGLRHSDAAMVRNGLADLSTFVLANQREAANLGYAYPAQFSDQVFEGADGERIAAAVGLQEAAGRPGLIVAHGLFSSRRFDYVRRIAVRAYYEWGFNVLALDLRSFGLTNLTSQAPTTAGWKEGEDIVAAGLRLKHLGASSVGAVGISLGGSAVLGACHADGAEEALDGGILAISPPADPRAVARRISVRLPRTDPSYVFNLGFWAMLTSRVRQSGWEGIGDFVDPMDKVSAPYYGVDPDELWERASAKHHIAAARVPVLILHPEDDEIVPVEHARMLAEAAQAQELVRVWVLPGGGHGAVDAVDRVWFYAVLRGFFERWAVYEELGGGGAQVSRGNRSRAKLINSAAR